MRYFSAASVRVYWPLVERVSGLMVNSCGPSTHSPSPRNRRPPRQCQPTPLRCLPSAAASVAPTFCLDETNAPAVVEICRRLDGIPLAIELAAARVASLQPMEIAALLDERFRLLTGSRRRGVERHQTLRATVDWSYSLLAEVERMVFDRLGVFVGSFDTTAASRSLLMPPWDASTCSTCSTSW